ncbi:MAG TPA: cytochrome P450 [Sandaracinaceae bacterium LLY-WYZ-13_1]|nr:cytochrome P450 [Sandaracinaceae bacterium LLY-WYZ-13_1]
MAAEAEDEAARWENERELDAAAAMMEMTLRIVCRTLFGHDARGDTAAVRRAMHTFQSSLVALSLPLSAVLSPSHWRLKRATDALDRIIYGMIEERRRTRAPRPDLLQRLLEAVDAEGDGRGPSEREVRHQLVTLFLAGHETTADALTWTFYLLSQNPRAEARLHAGLDDVLAGRHRRRPAGADPHRLGVPGGDAALPAGLRDRPAGRRGRHDRGGSIPAGSELVPWLWHTHRDPRWFDEPWAFRPERLAPDAVAARPRGACPSAPARAPASGGSSPRWRAARPRDPRVALAPDPRPRPRGGSAGPDHPLAPGRAADAGASAGGEA